MAGPLPRTSRTDSGPSTELGDEAWLREEELDIGSRQDPEPTLLDNDHNWTFPGELTPEAKRLVLRKVLEVAMRTTFSNHIYLFYNNLFRQEKGGPIGLRLSGVVARIVMDHWARKFLHTLQTNKVMVYLLRSM